MVTDERDHEATRSFVNNAKRLSERATGSFEEFRRLLRLNEPRKAECADADFIGREDARVRGGFLGVAEDPPPGKF